MKRLIIFLTLVDILAVPLVGARAAEPNQPSKDPKGVTEEYRCPKHPHMRASWPARCPICGATCTQPEKRQYAPERMMSMRSGPWEIRRKIMMNTRMDVFDPEAVLCAKRYLDSRMPRFAS